MLDLGVHSGRTRFSFALLAGMGALLGCADPTEITADFTVGTDAAPVQVVVATSSVTLPDALIEPASMPPTIATLSCDSTGECPSSPDVGVTCVDNVCDPDPIPVSAPLGDTFDLETYRRSLEFADIDSVEIRDIEYAVPVNTLSIDLPALTILWSGAGDTSGRTVLGTIPPIAAGEQRAAEMVIIDEAGNDALSEFLLTADAPRVRFWVETAVDVAPGQPFEGSAEVRGIIHVRIVGSLL